MERKFSQFFICISYSLQPKIYLVIVGYYTVAVLHVYKIRSVYNNRFVCNIRSVWCRKWLLNQLLNSIVNYPLPSLMLGYYVEIVVFLVQCLAFETILVAEVELTLEKYQHENNNGQQTYMNWILNNNNRTT